MSRFLDERGRIFGKVSVVDILVLLVIIAVVAFAAVRLTGSSSVTVPVKVTYTVEAVRQATVDALQQSVKVKGTVRDDGGTVLGIAVDIGVTPTSQELMTPDGQLKAFASLIFSDVNIIVRGEGRLSGSAGRIGGIPMAVGHKVTLITGSAEVQSVIMHVVWGAEAIK